TPATPIYTLSLHDALPIYQQERFHMAADKPLAIAGRQAMAGREVDFDDRFGIVELAHRFGAKRLDTIQQHSALQIDPRQADDPRSEEHTSELQSRGHLVCR